MPSIDTSKVMTRIQKPASNDELQALSESPLSEEVCNAIANTVADIFKQHGFNIEEKDFSPAPENRQQFEQLSLLIEYYLSVMGIILHLRLGRSWKDYIQIQKSCWDGWYEEARYPDGQGRP